MAGKWTKALGLAGILGLAATGAVVAREERKRRAYSADEIRDRLQQRYAEIGHDARAEAAEAWRDRRSVGG
jgi:Leu/Phe-tRNA-protein transferase